MIVPNGGVHSTSPSCVIKGQFSSEANLKRKFQEDQYLFTSFDVDTVSFSKNVTEHKSPWTMDDKLKRDIWYSRSDVDTFKKVARRDSKAFLRRHRAFTESFHAMFQDCSRPNQRLSELQDTDSVKTMMSFPTDIRGLECRVIPLLKKYRTFHAQSVLNVAGKSDSFRRTRSMSTSRPSRKVARLLAYSDAKEVASIVREELNKSNNRAEDRSDHDDDGHETLDDNFLVI